MTKQVSLVALAQLLEAGEAVFIAGSAGEPIEFSQLLVEQPALAAGVRFVTSFVPGINGRNLAAASSQRRMQVFFMQPDFRAGRQQGLIDFSPMTYFGIQQHLLAATTRIDTVIVQLSEPDANGVCSLGPSAEFMPGLLQRAGRILAIINPNIPRLSGAPSLNLASVAAYAQSSAALAQYDAGRSNESSDRIAAHIVGLIPDGATLQAGLGKVPTQMLRALAGHRDLAFHTGMLSDSIFGLVESGALRKQQALTTTVAVGTAALYPQLAALADLQLAPVAHTHDPRVLDQINKLYAINSAIEIDLLGQVNAEMLGGRYLSGPGGLPDFAHAAHRCVDGLSIIALPASDPSGRQSRIVPRFAAGTPVSVPQHDVDAVVTEYGVAHLRGLAIDERMQRLIAIAHPDHREALAQAGRQLLADS